MPIKLNGTTILDESTLANKDLSNISSAGNNVINNIATTAANQAIASANYMKHINTKAGTHWTATSNNSSFTCPSNGWIVLSSNSSSGNYIGSSASTASAVITLDSGIASFPVIAGTVIFSTAGIGNTQLTFFPEI